MQHCQHCRASASCQTPELRQELWTSKAAAFLLYARLVVGCHGMLRGEPCPQSGQKQSGSGMCCAEGCFVSLGKAGPVVLSEGTWTKQVRTWLSVHSRCPWGCCLTQNSVSAAAPCSEVPGLKGKNCLSGHPQFQKPGYLKECGEGRTCRSSAENHLGLIYSF